MNTIIDPDFEHLLEYLRESRGFDFTGYKPASLQRRIQKRMAMVSIETYGDYVDYLQVHPQEYEELFNTILINVTSFFRDKPAWDYVRDEIIPQIILSHRSTDEIRVWCAGCASGEEAYSIAILLIEALGDEQFKHSVKIYATDVDEQALTQARRACYKPADLEEINEDLRNRYFVKTAEGYVFRSDLRRQLIFGRHDLVQDAPISRLDLLICRNTLMYLNSETQSDILNRMHFALRSNGYLFLGKAEMMLTRTTLFQPTDLKYRVFTKTPSQYSAQSLYLPQTSSERRSVAVDTQLQLWSNALDAMDEAMLIVNRAGVLLMVNQVACDMLAVDIRDIGRPLQDLEVSYRPVELRSLIDRVYVSRSMESIKNIERGLPNNTVQHLEVKIMPLGKDKLLGVCVVFTDVTRFHNLQRDLERVNQDMETTNEELQSSNEELETTNEELQSTNEELETTNEELESTNEELETMNEELQSTNEELETLNNELRQHSEEIADANAFLNAILASMESGVIVIDAQMYVLSWSEAAMEMWGLRSDEVKGLDLLSLDIGLPVDQLAKPIHEFIDKSETEATLELLATNRRGRQFTCQVKLTPLVTNSDQRIGVILLMEEKNQE